MGATSPFSRNQPVMFASQNRSAFESNFRSGLDQNIISPNFEGIAQNDNISENTKTLKKYQTRTFSLEKGGVLSDKIEEESANLSHVEENKRYNRMSENPLNSFDNSTPSRRLYEKGKNLTFGRPLPRVKTKEFSGRENLNPVRRFKLHKEPYSATLSETSNAVLNPHRERSMPMISVKKSKRKTIDVSHFQEMESSKRIDPYNSSRNKRLAMLDRQNSASSGVPLNANLRISTENSRNNSQNLLNPNSVTLNRSFRKGKKKKLEVYKTTTNVTKPNRDQNKKALRTLKSIMKLKTKKQIVESSDIWKKPLSEPFKIENATVEISNGVMHIKPLHVDISQVLSSNQSIAPQGPPVQLQTPVKRIDTVRAHSNNDSDHDSYYRAKQYRQPDVYNNEEAFLSKVLKDTLTLMNEGEAQIIYKFEQVHPSDKLFDDFYTHISQDYILGHST